MTSEEPLLNSQNIVSPRSESLQREQQVEENLEREYVDAHQRSCCGAFRFFLRHSFRDVKRRKCHFCFAFLSVFIVVFAILVINTVIAKGPIIFLTMAEGDEGEIDGIFTAVQFNQEDFSTADNRDGNFLNYT